MANSNPADPSSYRGDARDTWKGRALAIVRPTGSVSGLVTLTATAEGLGSATIRITLDRAEQAMASGRYGDDRRAWRAAGGRRAAVGGASRWNVPSVGPGRLSDLSKSLIHAADMLRLGVSLGKRSHRVSTVNIGQHGDAQGGGRAAFADDAAGGTFPLDATADIGVKIMGTITCECPAGIVADGGG